MERVLEFQKGLTIAKITATTNGKEIYTVTTIEHGSKTYKQLTAAIKYLNKLGYEDCFDGWH